MASGLESVEVFESRARQFGISAAVVRQLRDADIGTMGAFAWCCGFQPGAQDEAPLIAAMTAALNGAPSVGLMAQLRRLFYESHTASLMDMRSRLDRNDDDAPKKIQLPERIARFDQLRLRYPGLLIAGEYEFSYALMDRVVDQYERNELRYIELSECTRRSQEMDGVKRDENLRIDIKKGGDLKLASEVPQLSAPLATDLEIRNAFMRRALAYDAGGLITFTVQELWIVQLFRLLQEPPVEGYSQITIQQIYRADKRLWAKVAEATRANIVPMIGQPKPLDVAMQRLVDHVEVTFLLLPLQSARGSSQAPSPAFPPHPPIQVVRDAPYAKASKGGKGGKGNKGDSGKAGGKKGDRSKPKVSVSGCAYMLPGNKPACVFFNSAAGCNDKKVQVGKRCSRGFHLCGKVLSSGNVCGGSHAMHDCPAV